MSRLWFYISPPKRILASALPPKLPGKNSRQRHASGDGGTNMLLPPINYTVIVKAMDLEDTVALRQEESVQQTLETVSEQFCCGELLFDDSHLPSKVLLQKQNMICLTPIKKGYHTTPRCRLLLKDPPVVRCVSQSISSEQNNRGSSVW